jgi:hypothetical protein
VNATPLAPAAALIPLLFAACQTITAKSSYDPEYDFKRLKTFRLEPITQTQVMTLDRIAAFEKALREILANKGYEEVEKNPDFTVAVTAESTYAMQPARVEYHDVAIVPIVIREGGRDWVIWRGQGRLDYPSSTPGYEERIRQIVVQTLADFPPGP